MLTLRKAGERGHVNLGWLDSRHTFSFGDYYDPAHMGFGPLRVINDDRVAGGGGFPTHPHRDMEIVTVVLDGALEHKDSLGTGSVIRAGDVQRMTAGSGVSHSEFNASKDDPVRLLQIWIVPEARGLKPSYEQKSFGNGERDGGLRLVGARDGRDGAVTIHRDVDLYAGILADGREASHALRDGRKAWVQVARGAVDLNGEKLAEGDGAALENEATISLKARGGAEVLVFDMG